MKKWTPLMLRHPDMTNEAIEIMKEPGHTMDREYMYYEMLSRHEDIDYNFLGELSYDIRMWKYQK